MQIKNQTCVLVDYSYKAKFSNILAIGQKYFNFYPIPIANFLMVKQFFSWLGRFIYKLG